VSSWRRSALSIRLVAVFGLLVAATVLFVAGVTTMVARAQLAHTLDRQLQSTARSFQTGPAARTHGSDGLAARTRQWLAEHPLPAGQMAAIHIHGGRVLTSAGGDDLFEVPAPRTLLTSRGVSWRNLGGTEGRVRALTVPIVGVHGQVGTLVLLAYTHPLDRVLGAVLSGTEWASSAALVVALLLGGFVVAQSLRPLRLITAQVGEIERTGELSRRVSRADAPGEVGALAAAFDRMLATLDYAFQNQRRFLADASHELRTPLTVVRGQLELLAEQLDGPAKRALDLTQQELDRMARIIDDLLLLAHLDEGMQLRAEPIELELLLREASLRSALLARRKTRVETEPGLYACGDADRLLQVLTNLVTNAVKHTDESCELVLASRRENSHVVVHVSDNGCGIPPSELPRVFERFYRGSDQRAGRPDGAGLGLPIARALVEAMHGAIDVDSRTGVGTTFTLRLPIWPASVPTT
jgi:two-component system OmpR family sensor kinase